MKRSRRSFTPLPSAERTTLLSPKSGEKPSLKGIVARSKAALTKLKRSRESSKRNESLGIVPTQRNIWSILILFQFLSSSSSSVFLSPPFLFSLHSIFIHNKNHIKSLRTKQRSYIRFFFFLFLCPNLSLTGWSNYQGATVLGCIFWWAQNYE